MQTSIHLFGLKVQELSKKKLREKVKNIIEEIEKINGTVCLKEHPELVEKITGFMPKNIVADSGYGLD